MLLYIQLQYTFNMIVCKCNTIKIWTKKVVKNIVKTLMDIRQFNPQSGPHVLLREKKIEN